jgi:uncharacterized protein YqfA (UPF0365 family)
MSLLAIGKPIVIVIAIVMVVAIVSIFFMFAMTLFPWLQAYMSGTPVSMFSILGMQFRRIPVRTVVRFLIMAKQAGVSISCSEMESAYLQGVDLEKVTLAMIHAKREGKKFQFRELVEADLEDRLAEKLGS